MGSGIRLVYRNGEKGPLREIQAGSGYWSQNSSTQVIGAAGELVQIEVTWFDGSVQSVPIVLGKREYRVRYADI